ncbi:ceramidase [Rhabdaerophilum calidifontis]|uniref:ceramidase n=1 Tax=Rhabdaerophilum calidifontis TaxID=2604328 RepID=UPI001238752C|nr:ceramidase [Rhabdaerophilum calidifontis]
MQPDPRFLMAYCERLGRPDFWAEPLNAVTNGAFLVAAALGFALWLARKRPDWLVLALILLMVAIAIGSFLFHTIPNGTTVLMDVLPIQGFILVYFGLALRRFLGAPLWLALIGPLLFFAASAGFVELAGSRVLRGGVGYLPALLALIGFGLILAWRGRGAMGALPAGADAAYAARAGLWGDEARRAARGLLIAGGLFTLSLTLRTLDLPLCSSWPAGLHFLWHMLNASVLGVLVVTGMGRG